MYCAQAYVCTERSEYSLAADVWIKIEWLKVIVEYSPKDTYNADKTGLNFHAYSFVLK
jgi:hypothetical protein